MKEIYSDVKKYIILYTGKFMQYLPKKRWLSPTDFEKEFDISKSTQAKLRMQKKIPYSKVGRFIRYDREKIDKWFEDHTISDG